MVKKVEVSVSAVDVADVLELLEKHISRGSKQPADMVALALTAAECSVLLLKAHWPYEEDVEAKLVELRDMAKVSAIKLYRDYPKS